MTIEIKYYGAARNVTGSCTMVTTEKSRFLVDCGMYQERALKARNWEPLPAAPESINAVVLTHAHLDHCGRLPKLVKDGFAGAIFCTPATRELAEIILRDSARIQEEDIKFKQKRHAREGRASPYPYAPLYDTQDVERTVELFHTAPYHQPVAVAPGVTMTFHEAGHIFGSAFLLAAMDDAAGARTMLFSGDMGRKNLPIQRDPDPAVAADYLQLEATYGNRLHGATADIPGELAAIINETAARGGNIVIPSFAVERAQELLYHLGALLADRRIPQLPIFLDSPMAIRVTEVFKRHTELFDGETRALLNGNQLMSRLSSLRPTASTDESKAINDFAGPAIIIAGSGMCTGGRIKHHLKTNLPREQSAIVFVGYQAVGTLGRIILDGAKRVRLFGENCAVKAHVTRIEGFSGHADREELMAWLAGIKRDPRRVFINHGEEDAARAFAEALRANRGWTTAIPEYGQSFAL